jgi:hypothetical protein
MVFIAYLEKGILKRQSLNVKEELGVLTGHNFEFIMGINKKISG